MLNDADYANRAFANTKLENYGSAVADATKALEIDPKYIKVHTLDSGQTHVLCMLAWWRSLPQSRTRSIGAENLVAPAPARTHALIRTCPQLRFRFPLPPPPQLQAYYRRGDANFAMGRCKLALRDLRMVCALHGVRGRMGSWVRRAHSMGFRVSA